MDILKKWDYVSPQILLVIFEKKDVICGSGEDFNAENGGAWNPDWDLFE
jgi:hypothetical protein